jgi:D-alanyl-D-alanine carboxypeptidase
LTIISAYRSSETQRELYDEMIDDYLGRGKEERETHNATIRKIAYPGASEHQLGLAIDILPTDYRRMNNNTLTNRPEIQWLYQNSYRFGFILRYPDNTEHITGVQYEPWHFRYVGREAAYFMMTNNLTLEEFHELLENR